MPKHEDDAMTDAIAEGDSIDGGTVREEGDSLLTRRTVEAILFAAPEPLTEMQLAARLPEGADVAAALAGLTDDYAGRGIELVRVGEGWRFRTAGDLAYVLSSHATEERKLSRAALETLAIIAYHQPVTRAEIEDIRGVSTSKGIMDTLLETGFIRLRGRRRSPGRPVTFGTTPGFLDHFALADLTELPGIADLKSIGLLDRAGSDPNPFRNEPEDPLDADDRGDDDDQDGAAAGDGAETADVVTMPEATER